MQISSGSPSASTSNVSQINLNIVGAGGGAVSNYIVSKLLPDGSGYGITLNSGAPGDTLTIRSNNNIGINTTNPIGKLHVVMNSATVGGGIPGNIGAWDSTYSVFGQAGTQGGAVGIGFDGSGGRGIITCLKPTIGWMPLIYNADQHTFYYGPNPLFSIINDGNASLRGALTQNTSDIRLKKNIKNIDNSLQKVCSLNGITYDYNEVAKSYGFDETETQVGLLAQEVEAILPEVIKPAPFDYDTKNKVSKSGENYKTIQYEKLVPLLVEAIKELTERVKYLESKLNTS